MPKTNTVQNRATHSAFLNFSNLSDEQAGSLVGKLTEVVQKAEQDRSSELSRAEEALSIWHGNFWSDEEIEYFEEKFNVHPYEFPAARAPLNKLVAQQRSARYNFQLLPTDVNSYDRHRKNREKFVEENYQDFDTIQQAREYYDKYYDDELAQAISIQYDNIRNENNTKYVESQCFENGVITGLDFLKTTYSTKDDPDGEIKTDRRSVRQMLWDHTSVDPMLDDAEYMGEVHRLYRSDLVSMFPDKKDQIEESFEEYTNFVHGGAHYPANTSSWRDFYDFDIDQHELRLKVCEFWYQDTEERFQLVNKDTGQPRLIQHGLSEAEIMEKLAQVELSDLEHMMKKGELDPAFFDRPQEQIMDDIDQQLNEKYDLRTTQAKVWYKAVFSHDALFEFKRSPLPQGGHPYTPFFAQFTEGWFTGVIDDIKDILLAYNKAIMFREIMLANSAKGLLFIDRGSVNKSGYSMDDIREAWTEIGGVIDLDLRGGRRLGDVFQQVTNVGDGLAEIRSVIAELESKIYRILGVNDAQLGFVGNEASAAQVRQRIQQGQGNNGLIFDNFNRTLETHAKENVIPMIVADLMGNQPEAIRGLADNREQWVKLNYDQEFELFADAILNGEFQMKLKTEDTDRQIQQQNEAMLLQLAQQNPNQISVEAALEYSEMPQIHNFLRRNRELMRRKQRDQALRQIDLQQLQQIMAEAGVDEDTASMIMKQGRRQAAKQFEQKESQGNQQGQGNSIIQERAKEPERMRNIETSALNQRQNN